jgi:hypothetical protein
LKGACAAKQALDEGDRVVGRHSSAERDEHRRFEHSRKHAPIRPQRRGRVKDSKHRRGGSEQTGVEHPERRPCRET